MHRKKVADYLMFKISLQEKTPQSISKIKIFEIVYHLKLAESLSRKKRYCILVECYL